MTRLLGSSLNPTIIPGVPQQQGSKKHIGRGVMVDDNKKLARWRAVAVTTLQAVAGPDWEPLTGPVCVTVQFLFPRPKSHYGTGRNADVLKPTAPIWKTSMPDTDKLQRALGDALTIAGVIRDDALIAEWRARKHYTTQVPCTALYLTELLP